MLPSLERPLTALSSMKRYAAIVLSILVAFLGLFFLVQWLNIPLLTDPAPWIERGGLQAALFGVGLLVADVVLPVPSSLVMLMHGALFGVLVGTGLSLAGSLGAASVGFAIGRHGGSFLSRVVLAEDRERANRLLTRYGALAIVITRPLPILAETVVILAGASPLGWRRAMLASFVGSLPSAILYAGAGALAVNIPNGALVFVLVVVVAGLFWLCSHLLQPQVTTH